MSNPTIAALDALYQVEMTVNALEGVETMALCGEANGDLQMVKIDHFVCLLYLVRSTLRQQVGEVERLLRAEPPLRDPLKGQALDPTG